MSARGDQTRARLIQATTDVVGQVGYARATTRAIAAAAGVAEGTIYRHFPDKRQLFFAAVLERNAPIIEWVEHLPELAGSATVHANLTESLRRLGRLRADLLPLELSLRADPELARSLQVAATTQGPPPGPPASLAAYLAAEQALGRVRPEIDAERTAIVVLATLFGLAMVPGDADADLGADLDAGLIDAAVEIVLTGIAPPRA